MHLILILIRWLMGFFGSGQSLVRAGWRRIAALPGTIRFRLDSKSAYCSGVGGMKFDLVFTELIDLLGRRPAHAAVSPHNPCILHSNPYQPDFSVVATAHFGANFSLPPPRAWG
jgi:hypothetical protein